MLKLQLNITGHNIYRLSPNTLDTFFFAISRPPMHIGHFLEAHKILISKMSEIFGPWKYDIRALGGWRVEGLSNADILPSSVKAQLPAAAKLTELQHYFAFHPPTHPQPPTPRASRF